jgi:small-conductance mechanosensitive channel
MRSKLGFFAVFALEAVGILFAVTCCQGWLFGAVDRAIGFSRAGERHDVSLPGEGRLLFTVCFVCVVAIVALVLSGVAFLTQKYVSKRVAAIASVPSALVGVAVYGLAVARRIHMTAPDRLDVVFLAAACGAIAGSLLCGGRGGRRSPG